MIPQLQALAKINEHSMSIPVGGFGRIAEISDKNEHDKTALEKHNEFRSRHIDTAPLVFDPALCEAALVSKFPRCFFPMPRNITVTFREVLKTQLRMES